eukprot:GHVT01020945.1.p1 GENE.GHVT01020945.1~~GHVT01020945.1.p1  ORF type:complete len:1087 (-),score=130.45 GHVT01020945.1:997-4257(-)
MMEQTGAPSSGTALRNRHELLERNVDSDASDELCRTAAVGSSSVVFETGLSLDDDLDDIFEKQFSFEAPGGHSANAVSSGSPKSASGSDPLGEAVSDDAEPPSKRTKEDLPDGNPGNCDHVPEIECAFSTPPEQNCLVAHELKLLEHVKMEQTETPSSGTAPEDWHELLERNVDSDASDELCRTAAVGSSLENVSTSLSLGDDVTHIFEFPLANSDGQRANAVSLESPKSASGQQLQGVPSASGIKSKNTSSTDKARMVKNICGFLKGIVDLQDTIEGEEKGELVQDVKKKAFCYFNSKDVSKRDEPPTLIKLGAMALNYRFLFFRSFPTASNKYVEHYNVRNLAVTDKLYIGRKIKDEWRFKNIGSSEFFKSNKDIEINLDKILGQKKLLPCLIESNKLVHSEDALSSCQVASGSPVSSLQQLQGLSSLSNASVQPGQHFSNDQKAFGAPTPDSLDNQNVSSLPAQPAQQLTTFHRASKASTKSNQHFSRGDSDWSSHLQPFQGVSNASGGQRANVASLGSPKSASGSDPLCQADRDAVKLDNVAGTERASSTPPEQNCSNAQATEPSIPEMRQDICNFIQRLVDSKGITAGEVKGQISSNAIPSFGHRPWANQKIQEKKVKTKWEEMRKLYQFLFFNKLEGGQFVDYYQNHPKAGKDVYMGRKLANRWYFKRIATKAVFDEDRFKNNEMGGLFQSLQYLSAPKPTDGSTSASNSLLLKMPSFGNTANASFKLRQLVSSRNHNPVLPGQHQQLFPGLHATSNVFNEQQQFQTWPHNPYPQASHVHQFRHTNWVPSSQQVPSVSGAFVSPADFRPDLPSYPFVNGSFGHPFQQPPRGPHSGQNYSSAQHQSGPFDQLARAPVSLVKPGQNFPSGARTSVVPNSNTVQLLPQTSPAQPRLQLQRISSAAAAPVGPQQLPSATRHRSLLSHETDCVEYNTRRRLMSASSSLADFPHLPRPGGFNHRVEYNAAGEKLWCCDYYPEVEPKTPSTSPAVSPPSATRSYCSFSRAAPHPAGNLILFAVLGTAIAAAWFLFKKSTWKSGAKKVENSVKSERPGRLRRRDQAADAEEMENDVVEPKFIQRKKSN